MNNSSEFETSPRGALENNKLEQKSKVMKFVNRANPKTRTNLTHTVQEHTRCLKQKPLKETAAWLVDEFGKKRDDRGKEDEKMRR